MPTQGSYRKETRWGDTLNQLVINGRLVPVQRRAVQIEEIYSRAWVMRTYISLSRALDVGESLDLAFGVTEGAGSSAATWQQLHKMGAGDQFLGPFTENVAARELIIDNIIQAGTIALGSLTVSMVSWAAPVVPVYPEETSHG